MLKNLILYLIIICTHLYTWGQSDTLFVSFKVNKSSEIGYFNQYLRYEDKGTCNESDERFLVEYHCLFNRILPDTTASIEEEMISIAEYIDKQHFYFSYLTDECEEDKDALLAYLEGLKNIEEYSKFDVYQLIDRDSIDDFSVQDVYRRVLPKFKEYDSIEVWRDGYRVRWEKSFENIYRSNFKTYNRIVKDSSIVNHDNFIDFSRQLKSKEAYFELFERIKNANHIYLTQNKSVSGRYLFQEVVFNKKVPRHL